ncbi:uncharacterized protein ASCRUDRAFT_71414 [Ascoidea rubescens DSM 1968]|uniref:SUN domain-containing protein n=1 Tax=Ascoidea rubescens DSM 1968 TaxID=1344418 RepID=A0A1D2VE81_9ASCO|nr:hypothetical protein ASCRUDRAFT_71414 [Ascoidea rubescens DSM 1968]ODV59936.1 hypothetical protein ASCRUDRAFT_71414 [Ascoidea rubescens DSM 1968]
MPASSPYHFNQSLRDSIQQQFLVYSDIEPESSEEEDLINDILDNQNIILEDQGSSTAAQLTYNNNHNVQNSQFSGRFNKFNQLFNPGREIAIEYYKNNYNQDPYDNLSDDSNGFQVSDKLSQNLLSDSPSDSDRNDSNQDDNDDTEDTNDESTLNDFSLDNDDDYNYKKINQITDLNNINSNKKSKQHNNNNNDHNSNKNDNNILERVLNLLKVVSNRIVVFFTNFSSFLKSFIKNYKKSLISLIFISLSTLLIFLFYLNINNSNLNLNNIGENFTLKNHNQNHIQNSNYNNNYKILLNNLQSDISNLHHKVNNIHDINQNLYKNMSTFNSDLSDFKLTYKNNLLNLNQNLYNLNLFRNQSQSILNNLIQINQKNNPNNLNQFDNFNHLLKKNLPNYLPIIINENNKNLTLLPVFENYLKNFIQTLIENNINTSNNTITNGNLIPTWNQFLIKNNIDINHYFNNLIHSDSNFKLLNIKNEKLLSDLNLFKNFISSQLRKNYNSLNQKILKNYQLINLQNNISNNNSISSNSFIINSTTELILEKLVSKILNKLKFNSNPFYNYNYASLTNGAIIINNLVSSHNSFNITHLNIIQNRNELKNTLYNFFSKNSQKRKFLILNSYKAISNNLNKFPIDKLNNYYKIPQSTGIKTFAVKFQTPIYIRDLIISYPRYKRNASFLYAAPKKISIWFQLNNFENNAHKLKEFIKIQKKIKCKQINKNINNHNATELKITINQRVNYELFYEKNFNLKNQNFIKIDSMTYDINSLEVDQPFKFIQNKDFKDLKLLINSIFFSVESNYGDNYNTNLFKLKVFGVNQNDLNCIHELLLNDYNDESTFNRKDFKDELNKKDINELEKLFNDRFISEGVTDNYSNENDEEDEDEDEEEVEAYDYDNDIVEDNNEE